jgi:hypothetical protein
MIGDPVPSWEEMEGNEEEELTYLMSNSGQPAPTVLFLSVACGPGNYADSQVPSPSPRHPAITT